MSMNLPCLRTADTVRPANDETGGSYVLRTANEAGSISATTAPSSFSPSQRTSASTSGISGMATA
jgi:hypothetical protein